MRDPKAYRYGFVALSLAFFLLGCGESGSSEATSDERATVEREGNPDVIYYDETDDKMNRAMKRAKETYTQLVEAIEKQDPAIIGLSVKKPFKATEGFEHIWISDITWDGQAFNGIVGNEPVNVPGVAYGQPTRVTPEELSDWMFIRDGKLHGGYTIRVMIDSYPADEREAMQQQMGFEVPPIDF